MQLNRSISTFTLLFFAVGGIVGSGWLFGPFYAAKMAGPAAILAWVIGGVLMMFVALTFAELAAMFPLAGGSIRFLQLSHGTFVGFTFAWIAWISSLSVAPIETMALLQYATHYFPWLMHTVSGVPVLTSMGMLVAVFIMGLMCVINVAGVKYLSCSSNLLVFFKLLVPIITAVMLLHGHFHVQNFTVQGFLPSGWRGVLMALPSAGIVFSFIGYSPAIQLAGEAKHPQRAVPLAIIGALLICIVLYFFLQSAFVGAVSSDALTSGWQHLSFVGEMGPFAGIVATLGLTWLVYVLYLDAFISPFGTGLIYTGSTARMAYGMGRNGYMPQFLLKLNATKTPGRLILLNFVLGLFLFLPFPSWQTMMSFLVSALVFAYAVGPLALIVLRKKVPDQPRPFRLPAAKYMAFIAFYVCNLILLWTGWATIYKMLIAVGIGYVMLLSYRFMPKRTTFTLHGRDVAWLPVYLIALAGLSYSSSFGGGLNLLPFGWDFLIVGLVSLAIYYWAYQSGIRSKTLLAEL